MEKKRLAYVDYWSHKYTRSGDFLREILSEEFEITDFWWRLNDKIPLNEINKSNFIAIRPIFRFGSNGSGRCIWDHNRQFRGNSSWS